MRLLTMTACCVFLASCTEAVRWSDHGGGHRTPPSPSASTRRHGPEAQTYTVKRGDTLYSISTRNGLDYHDVAAWNGIGSDYRLEVGQELRLGPKGSTARPGATRRSKAPPSVADSEAKLEPHPAGKDASEPVLERYYQWQWPLSGAIAKTYAPEGGSKGLDIGGEVGQTVIAAAPGRVVYSGSGLKGYGELVIIKHDETYLSAYGYNRKRLVAEGDLVTAGQAIAELGLGPEQKPLLHFEIREHGKPLDPLPMLPKLPN
jgi:lipoprotein NlpD